MIHTIRENAHLIKIRRLSSKGVAATLKTSNEEALKLITQEICTFHGLTEETEKQNEETV